MNFWKKLFKYNRFIIIGIIIASIIILIVITSGKPKIKFMTIAGDYNIIVDNEPAQLEIDAYTTEINSSFFIKDHIVAATIMDNVQKDAYLVNVNTIDNNDSSKMKVDKTIFYRYQLTINFPFLSNDDIIMRNAYLHLTYQSEETVILYIGSIILAHCPKNYNLNIMHLKGVINYIGNTPILTGIALKIKNPTAHLINLSDVKLVNCFATVQREQVQIIDEIDFDNNIDISLLLNDHYIYNKNNQSPMVPISISPGQEIVLLLPLNYDMVRTVSQSGIILTYQMAGAITEQAIANFRFFSINYEYRDLTIVAYEVNRH